MTIKSLFRDMETLRKLIRYDSIGCDDDIVVLQWLRSGFLLIVFVDVKGVVFGVGDDLGLPLVKQGERDDNKSFVF